MILTPHITEAGASPAIYDTQSLENEFKDFDDNKFLKDIKKSERSQAEAKIKAQQKELAKEMKELQKEQINKVCLIAFKNNEVGNVFWKSVGWTFREDLNYYDFTLNEENITRFNS